MGTSGENMSPFPTSSLARMLTVFIYTVVASGFVFKMTPSLSVRCLLWYPNRAPVVSIQPRHAIADMRGFGKSPKTGKGFDKTSKKAMELLNASKLEGFTDAEDKNVVQSRLLSDPEPSMESIPSLADSDKIIAEALLSAGVAPMKKTKDQSVAKMDKSL